MNKTEEQFTKTAVMHQIVQMQIEVNIEQAKQCIELGLYELAEGWKRAAQILHDQAQKEIYK